MNVRERVSRVLLMMADEQREMDKMEAGNIAVAIGMKSVRKLADVTDVIFFPQS